MMTMPDVQTELASAKHHVYVSSNEESDESEITEDHDGLITESSTAFFFEKTKNKMNQQRDSSKPSNTWQNAPGNNLQLLFPDGADAVH